MPRVGNSIHGAREAVKTARAALEKLRAEGSMDGEAVERWMRIIERAETLLGPLRERRSREWHEHHERNMARRRARAAAAQAAEPAPPPAEPPDGASDLEGAW